MRYTPARDNRSSECAACTAKARDLVTSPLALPPEFWENPRMRDALDSWHMGAVISAYWNHPYHGRILRQEIVAGWVGITQAQLSRIENGQVIKDIDKLIQWARTLDIPAHLLWFKLPEQRHTPALCHPSPHMAAFSTPMSLPAAGPFQLVRVGGHAGQVDGLDMVAMIAVGPPLRAGPRADPSVRC
jgi:hypothetical protein